MKADNDEVYKFGLDVLTEQAPYALDSTVNALLESEDADPQELAHAIGESERMPDYASLWKGEYDMFSAKFLS
jgi:hypothetical protein